MKGQLFNKIVLLLVCSFLVVSTFAQDDPPTLPNDPEGITDYLPLTLVSFSAEVKNGITELDWKTANEVNVSNFSVEKSYNVLSYNSIGSVVAKNSITNSYEFSDNIMIQNVVYYRLKMIDNDGSYRYSATLLVKNSAISKLSIYPNPAINSVTVAHGIPIGKASLSIVNIAGTILQTIPVNSNTQQTSITIKSNISTGTYLLQYVDDKGVETLQFVKL